MTASAVTFIAAQRFSIISALAECAALVRLRTRRVSRRAVFGLALLPLLLLAAGPSGSLLPDEGTGSALLLLPTAWVAFAVTVLVASATAGTRSLLPRDQSIAFPVGAGAEHLGALLLAPLNLAWMIESIGLLVLGGWVFGEGRLDTRMLPGLLLTALWIATCTAIAQLAGWVVELVRTTRSGPWVLRGLVLALAAGAIALAATGAWAGLADRSPTLGLVVAGLATDDGPRRWLTVAGLLLATMALAVAAGPPLVSRLQRRPVRDQAKVESRRYPGRADPPSALVAALRMDRAGVWRSVPLRRGLLTLAVVPGAAAAVAGLEWPMLALLPGLVASGAGLLFGVNALSLDGSGAIWRETLPGGTREWMVARLVVIAEICAGAAVLAVLLGAARSPSGPSGTQLVAVVGAVVATTAQVLARCARWSLRRPYPATLRDPRDQPAPPAAMAGYSVRLALGTTATGLVLVGCAEYGLGAIAAGTSLGVTLWSARHIVGALRSWDDDVLRSRVVSAVARG